MAKLTLDAALQSVPVIPVIVLERAADAVPVAEALIAGGIPVFEITLRTEAALSAIGEIAKRFPDALTGAGTVLSKSQATQAIDAGEKQRYDRDTTAGSDRVDDHIVRRGNQQPGG